MKTIWKFPIPIADEFAIEMPEGADVLHVGIDPQHTPCVWALVHEEHEKVARRFSLRGTGHTCDEGISGTLHVGTFAMGALVLHLFETEPSNG